VPIPTEFYRRWIVGERTGKRRRTTYKMTQRPLPAKSAGREGLLWSAS